MAPRVRHSLLLALPVMTVARVTQVGFVEAIAEVLERPVEFRDFDPALLTRFEKPGLVFGQNPVYDCSFADRLLALLPR